MKEGTIFDHPTKDGGVVRLKAVKRPEGLSILCPDCVFGGYVKCRSLTLEDKPANLRCSENADNVIFIFAEDKLHRIMSAIKQRTGIHDLEVLESEIKTILEK